MVDDTEVVKDEADILQADSPPSEGSCLHKWGQFRYQIQQLESSQQFAYAVYLVIFVNSLGMALYRPTEPYDSPHNSRLEIVDTICLAVFTIEMLIKWLAIGLKGYFKDGFNYLDFVVVVIGIVGLIPGLGDRGSGVAALRTLRVLRPLRTITAFRGLRILVKTIMAALPMCMVVILLMLYIFSIFGVYGVLAYGGSFKNRCVSGSLLDPETGDLLGASYDIDLFEEFCTKTDSVWPGHFCEKDTDVCTSLKNPNHGFTSYDNLLWALLVIFQCVTLEGWTEIMYWTQDSNTGFATIYYILIVIIGSFFLLNLLLAVVSEAHLTSCDAEDAADATQNASAPSTPGKAEIRSMRKSGIDMVKKEYGRLSQLGERLEKNIPGGEQGKRTWKWVQARTYTLVTSSYFSWLVIGLIIANAILLAMNYSGASKEYVEWLERMNMIITILFLIEMFLKMTGLGFLPYCRDNFNLFDIFVNIGSTYELLSDSGTSISVLRTIRVVRILRLFGNWPYMQKFLHILFRTFKELGNFAALLFLMVFVFALLGMQLFGGNFGFLGEGEPKPRSNFDTLLWSMLTVFQVLTGENWNEIMYNGMRASGEWSAIYFVILVLMGNYFIVNLFIAILLSSFESNRRELLEERKKNRKKVVQRWQKAITVVLQVQRMNRLGLGSEEAKRKLQRKPGRGRRNSIRRFVGVKSSADIQEEQEKKALAFIVRSNSIEGGEGEGEGGSSNNSFNTARSTDDDVSLKSVSRSGSRRLGSRTPRTPNSARMAMRAQAGLQAAELASKEQAELEAAVQLSFADRVLQQYDIYVEKFSKTFITQPPKDCVPDNHGLALFEKNSFLVLSPYSPFRRRIYDLVTQRWFDIIVLTLICVNSIVLAVECPALDDDPTFSELFEKLDFAFTLIFLVEMLLKIAALGLYGERFSYLSDSWNRMDCLIVVTSLVYEFGGVVVSSLDLAWVRVLRTLRVLRPLRMINKLPNLKIVVSALLASFPALGSLVVVAVFFWFVFGILGMTLYMGKFHFCTDPDPTLTEETCVGLWAPPGGEGNFTLVEREWRNKDQNFDNIGKAVLTLFEMSTTEQWVKIMWDGVDAVNSTSNPRRNHNTVSALFFVFFMLFGAFFIVNLFVGIVMDKFAAKRDEMGTSHLFATEGQRQWVENVKSMINAKPAKAVMYKQNWRNAVYDFIHTDFFELGIIGCIIINTLVMATYHDGQTEGWTNLQNKADLLFTVIFALEAVIKIIGLGPKRYLSYGWNCMDFFIVVILSLTYLIHIELQASVLRMLRVTRLLRMVKELKAFCALFETLIVAIPTLLNVGALLTLVFFIYAVLGVSFFGRVSQDQEFINRSANFSNFGIALLTLLRMSTGEDWNGLMYDCTAVDQQCEAEGHETGCGGTERAYFFYVTFTLIGNFIMINLFVAVVLENYNSSVSVMFSSDNLDDFRKIWQQFDTDGLGVVTERRLVDLLELVDPPLALPRNAKGKIDAKGFIQSNVNLIGTQVKWALFYDVLLGLCTQAYSEHTENLPPQVKAEIEDLLKMSRSRIVLGTHIGLDNNRNSLVVIQEEGMSEEERAQAEERVRLLSSDQARRAAVYIQQRYREYRALSDLTGKIEEFHRVTETTLQEEIDQTALVSRLSRDGLTPGLDPLSNQSSDGRSFIERVSTRATVEINSVDKVPKTLSCVPCNVSRKTKESVDHDMSLDALDVYLESG